MKIDRYYLWLIIPNPLTITSPNMNHLNQGGTFNSSESPPAKEEALNEAGHRLHACLASWNCACKKLSASWSW